MPDKNMRVLFMGTPEFALPTLKALAEKHEVCLMGRNWNNATIYGVFTLNVNNAVRNSNANIGTRQLGNN